MSRARGSAASHPFVHLLATSAACGLLFGASIDFGYAQQREMKGGETAKPAALSPAAAKATPAKATPAKATPAKRTPAKPAAAKPAAKPAVAPPATYQVVKRDTLFRIAAKVRHPGVTLSQMVLGLYRANPDAFREGRINDLIEGRILNVPSKEAVESVDPKQAALELRVLTAKPAVPVPLPPPEVKEPVAKPPAVPPGPPKPALRAPAPALTPAQAAERYQQAAAAERSGDLRAALQAYLEAGESGHGAAQKKLGDIYNAGNAVVTRDYETALRWYQKARAQGIEIPKPHTYPATRP